MFIYEPLIMTSVMKGKVWLVPIQMKTPGTREKVVFPKHSSQGKDRSFDLEVCDTKSFRQALKDAYKNIQIFILKANIAA